MKKFVIRMTATLSAVMLSAVGLSIPASAAIAAPAVDPKAYPYTPAGQAWVNVPVNDRVYLMNRGMVQGQNWNGGDDVIRYLPAGQSCTYDGGTTVGFEGPSMYWTQIDGSPGGTPGSLDCTTDVAGQRADNSVPFGFTINFGGTDYTGGYLIPAGAIVFAPDEYTYGNSAARAVLNLEASGIAGFGADLMPYFINSSPTTSSQIWTAQTIIDGKAAFVASWEQIRAWGDNTRDFSFQIVIINDGDGNFTTWFNYDKISDTNSIGYNRPQAFGNFVDGKVSDNEFRLYDTTGMTIDQCFTNDDLDSARAWELDLANDITFLDPGDNLAQSLKITADKTVKVFSDLTCDTPISADLMAGYKYFIIQEDAPEESVHVGWYVYDNANPNDIRVEITEFFPNIEGASLMDGGVSALIANSMNSTVPGRYIVGMVAGRTTGDDRLAELQGDVEVAVAQADPYDGPVVDRVTPTIVAPGGSVSLSGSKLDQVTKATINGVEVAITCTATKCTFTTPANLAPGTYDLVLLGSHGQLTVQEALTIKGISSAALNKLTWTKQVGSNSAKFYAKNITGAGKVQFFLNGKEIAWVRAVDETDPKLKNLNGSSYLVRSVELAPGKKNVLEIYINGVRTERTAHSR